VEFEINKAGMEQLERELQEKFSSGIQVPQGGSEADAIQSVKDQFDPVGCDAERCCGGAVGAAGSRGTLAAR
jgi:hypothetical protein